MHHKLFLARVLLMFSLFSFSCYFHVLFSCFLICPVDARCSLLFSLHFSRIVVRSSSIRQRLRFCRREPSAPQFQDKSTQVGHISDILGTHTLTREQARFGLDARTSEVHPSGRTLALFDTRVCPLWKRMPTLPSKSCIVRSSSGTADTSSSKTNNWNWSFRCASSVTKLRSNGHHFLHPHACWLRLRLALSSSPRGH